ncbi:nucleoside deaminase [Corynebacterium bovis]|uniref:nucleoside deaminase n=1 Tax=Corynebacterium bovis TaxID=36808 RepID=UPI0026B8C594
MPDRSDGRGAGGPAAGREGGRVIGAGLPREASLVRDEERMRRAVRLAASTPPEDVPVGAVVYGPDGRELAAATNRREADGDPTAHAEVLALRAAARVVGDSWRLEDCALVVTLEPCAMCAGAAVGARVGSVVFGAWEPRTGACGSVMDVPGESVLHRPGVRGGVLRDECEALLARFFARVRGG